MNRSHNKKRNVGIVFEQLVKYASQAVVENNDKVAEKVLKITNKFFRPGTELYKEFRLFNALYTTTMPSESLATRVIGEAKTYSRDFNAEKLYKEKSSLIHEINYSFSDKNFFSQKVNNYKTLATVQRLLDSWRDPTPDISSQAIYEAKLHNWMLQEKKVEDLEKLKTEDVDNLTVSIMTRKFNENFNHELLPEQAELLKSYIFSIGDDEKISEIFKSRKADCLSELNAYGVQCDSSIVKAKIEEVSNAISNLPTENIDDKVVSRYLTVMKLNNELRS